tara:strand:+ start:1073 stop:1759 length:687 start_codon:yes stop_codon:yes gene_type:complete
MGFFDNLARKFSDDKGIFRGGSSGQPFGRIKDLLAKTVPEGRQEQNIGKQLTQAFGMSPERMGGAQDIGHSAFQEGDPRLTPEFASARTAALDFDPSDPESVKGLQKKLGVTVDGKFGPQTEAALRSVQGQMPMNDPTSLLGFAAQDAIPGTGTATNLANSMSSGMGSGPSQGNMDMNQSYMSQGGYGEPPQWGGDMPIGDYVRGPLTDYYQDNPDVTPPPHLKDYAK